MNAARTLFITGAATALIAAGVGLMRHAKHAFVPEPAYCPLVDVADRPPTPTLPPRAVALHPRKKAKNNADLDQVALSGCYLEGIKEPGIVNPPEAAPAQGNDSLLIDCIDIPASFPGGDSMWSDYVRRTIMSHVDELQDKGESGTVRVLFTVAKDGEVCAAEALTLPGTKLAEIAVNAFLHGPKWKPAQQNGRLVQYSRCQKIAFQISNDSSAATSDTAMKKK